MIQWQQVYMLTATILVIVANLFLAGYNRKPDHLWNIFFVIWTFYVIYSAGFYKGLLY